MDSDKLSLLNAKIDDIYSSLSSVIETHCISKSELESFQNQANEKF